MLYFECCSPQSKKRKHMESPSAIYNRNGLQIPNIKQEPNGMFYSCSRL